MIRVVILSGAGISVKNIEPKLDTYYDIIGCDTIDIACRKIAGKYYDIIVDDEGLLKADPVIRAMDKKGNPMLVGNLIICKHDDEGNEASLQDGEIKDICSSITLAATGQPGSDELCYYPMLVCEY